MKYSFFYKPGTAGYVRGEQIATYLKARKNPEKDFLNDKCIYVKTIPEKMGNHTWLDIDDAPRALEWLKNQPKVGVIVNSLLSYDFARNELKRKDIRIIPHAHCNYERETVPQRDIKTVGIIGSKTSFQYPLDDFRKKLKEIGMELKYEQDYWKTYQYSREKVCEFYKSIDIQVVWRTRMAVSQLKNPNKLVNASSFGIPTVAYPEDGFKEWNGYYFASRTIPEMIEFLKSLKENPFAYGKFSTMVREKAEDYHIEKIAELYKKL